MSSSGGDGGASARQAQIEERKQVARNSLNSMFGEAPTILGAPSRATPGGSGFAKSFFDGQDSHQAALYNESSIQGQQAAANKVARESLYSGIRDNAFTSGKRRIDEKNDDASRKLKFSIFAQGLNGGSTDIDQNALLKRTYDNGLLDLGAKADSVAADVRGSDESTRLGLLQSIDAGTDQGSAISSALNQMRVNSDRAAAEAQGTDVGDLFANAPLLYQNSQRAQGAADARDVARYGTGAKAGQKAYSGQITPTS